MTAPLLQPYHVTPAASLAFGKSSLPLRARRQLGALSTFARMARPRLSFLDALDHQAGKLSDLSHRHVLSSAASTDGSKTIGKRFADEQKSIS